MSPPFESRIYKIFRNVSLGYRHTGQYEYKIYKIEGLSGELRELCGVSREAEYNTLVENDVEKIIQELEKTRKELGLKYLIWSTEYIQTNLIHVSNSLIKKGYLVNYINLGNSTGIKVAKKSKTRKS